MSNAATSDSTLPSFTPDETALAWANEHFTIQHQQLIADHPWSRVFRLEGKTETAFLKLFPRGDTLALEKNQLINQYFPDNTPSIQASDTALGVLLSKSDKSIPLGNFSSEQQLKRLLNTYAQIQAKATQFDELYQRLPRLNVTTLLTDLLDYLNPEKSLEKGVNAHYFMDDPRESLGYFIALSSRRAMLENYLQKAMCLPMTLNHCDLHTDNVSETEAGNMLFYDWDDAMIGPAGMSLYRLFHSCSQIAKRFDADHETDDSFKIHHAFIDHYLDSLNQHNYDSLCTLEESLAASVCAGMIQSMLSYKHYPDEDYEYKKYVSELIRDRVEDIVHLCDMLALKNRAQVLYYANDYEQNNAPWRSIYLLNEYAARHPNDVAIHQRQAELEIQSGRWACASTSLQKILAINPVDANTRTQLGIALLKSGNAEQAIRELEIALQTDPNQSMALDYIGKASELLHWKNRAAIPHLAPTLALSNEEKEHNLVAEEKLGLAINLFREHGMLVVENAFPRALMKDIAKQVFEHYDHYFENRKYEDNLVLGDKRRMVTLSIEGALNDPRLYGSQIIRGMMSNLLDEDYVMGGLNAVVSLPGSKDQGLHKDYSPLFKSEQNKEHHVTPPFAVAMLMPLIDMRYEHGTTSFRKGSHLVPEQMPFDMPTQEPLLKMGDCMIFDYRTAHEGLANRSDEVRPLLCLIHHRIWFRDALNYRQQKDVMITPEELEKVPEDLKSLFQWV